MQERVVITGMGAITALGQTVEDTWAKMVKGQSGVVSTVAAKTIN